MPIASPEMQKYFETLSAQFEKAYAIAQQARAVGVDPQAFVEVAPAADVAARVEGIVGPKGVSERIRELCANKTREEACFQIAREILEGKYGGETLQERIEQAVRTGLALATEGVVSAPIEGISRIEVRKNSDGSNYVAVVFAGPIRGAGGTGQAIALLLAEVCRQAAKISNYRPSGDEMDRAVEELNLYAMRTRAGQYVPTEEEIRHILQNCPVCVDGEPSEDYEISNKRGLYVTVVDEKGEKRVPVTNVVRSGMCLVISEGICLKAAKVLKIAKKQGLDWNWIEKMIKVGKQEKQFELKPISKYMDEIVAGRPIFSYPMRPGGFRLRYGRTRLTGIAAKGMHPASMIALGSFLAMGTQLKIERPGKGAVVTPCSEIDGPVVKLSDGSVVRLETAAQAEELYASIAEVLFIGDLLVSYGDFLKANHPLIPSGYCEEWHQKVLESKGIAKTLGEIRNLGAKQAVASALKDGVPLAPRWTYFWHDLKLEQLRELADWLAQKGCCEFEWLVEFKRLSVQNAPQKRLLELLCMPHKLEGEKIIVECDDAFALLSSMGLLDVKEKKISLAKFDQAWNERGEKSALEIVNDAAGFTVMRKAGLYIGSSMGRPEKAKPRQMKPPVNALFPIGLAGGKLRSLIKAVKNSGGTSGGNANNSGATQGMGKGAYGGKAFEGGKGIVELELANRVCSSCGTLGWKSKCSCGGHAILVKKCFKCAKVFSAEKQVCKCGGNGSLYEKKPINLSEEFKSAVAKSDFSPQELKAVIGLISDNKTAEPLEKGVLRAKHALTVFRDGTARFDGTEIPMTHFIPRESGVGVQKLRELGYEKDAKGAPLENDAQVVELRVQDLILPYEAADYFIELAGFCDDLLVHLYGQKPFYNLKSKQELLGQLVTCLAPHTSACVLSRVVGFTQAKGILAHPFMHCACRRNCFHPDTEILIWDSQNKEILREKLGVLTEKIMADRSSQVRKLDAKTLKVDSPTEFFAFSIDARTRKVIKRKIKCFLKTSTPQKWIRIRTTTNRVITVTPDHNMLYLDKGVLKSCFAEEVKIGTDLPIALNAPIPEVETKEIDLITELLRLPKELKQEIVARNEAFFKQFYYANRKSLRAMKEISLYGKRTPREWYNGVPLTDLETLYEKSILAPEDIPPSTRLTPKRGMQSNEGLPTKIGVSKELMRILGYYASEGHCRKNYWCHQISFRICNKEMFEELKSAIKAAFGITPNIAENRTKATICNKLLYLLFTKVWRTGEGAYSKRVPSIVLTSKKELSKEFLSAYLDGDGYVLDEPPRISFTSVSMDLLNDVSTLLLKFGVFGRLGTTKPRLPGKTVLERYKELGKKPRKFSQHYLQFYGVDLRKLAHILEPTNKKKRERIAAICRIRNEKSSRYIAFGGKEFAITPSSDFLTDKVAEISELKADTPAYCLDIETENNSLIEKNVLLNNQIFSIRCDGDEIAVMLLMDILLNFSRSYLPESRGGKMDAPLVLTSVLNTTEIDDEAHAMDCVWSYPLEFYEATLKSVNPGEAKIETVASRLDTERQYQEIGYTHECAMEGPERSAYVTLGSMKQKVEIELEMMRKIRAVDVAGAAERILLSHFFPDLYGNLRSFSKQSFRCVDCNAKYRRVPLAGKCTRNNCGGKLLLTINKGGIEKYLKLSQQMVADYGLPNYLKQRLQLVEKEIKSIFEDDKAKQFSLAEYA